MKVQECLQKTGVALGVWIHFHVFLISFQGNNLSDFLVSFVEAVVLPKRVLLLNEIFAKIGAIFMPHTSDKLRGHISFGLSIRPSVRKKFWQLRNSKITYVWILKFYMWHVHEK